jgi:uncharacterized protein (DUF608 family)
MSTSPRPDSLANASCSKPGCNCGVTRRDVLKILGAGATSILTGLPWAVAGPFEASDFENLVPADKRLNPDWVQSLFDRGTPRVYRNEELHTIGMPIGGICAGQLYLGGDGKLWHWDIFNQQIGTGDSHYAHPMVPSSPLEQGFAIRVKSGDQVQTRALDRTGFGEIAFRGEYPIGTVDYSGVASPVRVRLEAFSPFVPLNVEDSSLPATVMQFTVKNTSEAPLECELAGWLENAVCLHSGQPQAVTTVLKPAANLTLLEHAVVPLPAAPAKAARPDIVFADFEKETYEGWTAAGKAFGPGPVEKAGIPPYQGDVGGSGQRVVNSHASAPGDSIQAKDAQTGTLTSQTFEIARDYINFFIGGGAHKDRTCMNLLVDGQVVLTATGSNDNRMKRQGFDVRPWAGKKAQIQIVDAASEGWGNIGVDEIVFSDRPAEPEIPLADRADFGTLALVWIGPAEAVKAIATIADGPLPEAAFAGLAEGEKSSRKRSVASLVAPLSLRPGEAKTLTFAIAWHFPNLKLPLLPGGRHYATKFKSAADVAGYLAAEFDRLARLTRLWRDTWYDSTLPYWFLDRTFANTSTLATSTCHWFADGRFYGWEGVGCCAGTCAHVWHYAHSVARLFPQLERSARLLGDYGAGFQPNGAIFFRAEHCQHWAADAQAGCVLRTYREHQMNSDDAFLKGLWPRVKKSLEFLIARDGNADGILEGPQHNTLDADWYGQVAWLSGLYLAALRAGEEMAREMGDDAFARQCRAIFEKGRANVDQRLFNGEYYVHMSDPSRPKSVGSYDGCEIDQVFGQSWSWQVGLGRILDQSHVKKALESLWRYNFTPDVGPYRAAHKPGRWYAMPGEGGLLMCTWPRGAKMRVEEAFDFYFNECMNGFEYQVAWHMIAEGMVEQGLAIARMIDDRYHAARRNPWNEVECGDHYARSMASYGVFLAACGYECHGPKAHLGFAPRLSMDHFRAAFTTSEAWGTFDQTSTAGKQAANLSIRYGKLNLRTFSLAVSDSFQPTNVKVTVAGRELSATMSQADGRIRIELDAVAEVREGQEAEIVLS